MTKEELLQSIMDTSNNKNSLVVLTIAFSKSSVYSYLLITIFIKGPNCCSSFSILLFYKQQIFLVTDCLWKIWPSEDWWGIFQRQIWNWHWRHQRWSRIWRRQGRSENTLWWRIWRKRLHNKSWRGRNDRFSRRKYKGMPLLPLLRRV